MRERIRVLAADATTIEAGAILRSVDSTLEPVAIIGRRIELEAGAGVTERLRRIGELPAGGAVVTPGGALRADFLIHVVVRSREEPVTESGVRLALLNGLRRATDLGIERLVLPPLGIGAGNLDAEASAEVMIRTLREHLAVEAHPEEVVIAVASDYELDAFGSELERTTAPRGEES